MRHLKIIGDRVKWDNIKNGTIQEMTSDQMTSTNHDKGRKKTVELVWLYDTNGLQQENKENIRNKQNQKEKKSKTWMQGIKEVGRRGSKTVEVETMAQNRKIWKPTRQHKHITQIRRLQGHKESYDSVLRVLILNS